MKMFDYSELIRVIDNIEVREAKEKAMEVAKLESRYLELERSVVESGVLNDWDRLKKLCSKADIGLIVAQLGDNSMGILTGKNDYYYCKEYRGCGDFRINLYRNVNYGFKYDAYKGITWIYEKVDCFRDKEHKLESRIKALETFMDTYEDYRKFQLSRIDEKYSTRVKAEDIVKQFMF